jgi:hypothetical protein
MYACERTVRLSVHDYSGLSRAVRYRLCRQDASVSYARRHGGKGSGLWRKGRGYGQQREGADNLHHHGRSSDGQYTGWTVYTTTKCLQTRGTVVCGWSLARAQHKQRPSRNGWLFNHADGDVNASGKYVSQFLHISARDMRDVLNMSYRFIRRAKTMTFLFPSKRTTRSVSVV